MNRSAMSSMNLSGTTILRSVARAAVNFVRALRHRQAMRHLAEFDDRMLKDIGLSRSDVEGALTESLFTNMSVVLVRSVERQRHADAVDATARRRARPVVPLLKAGASCTC